MKISKLFHWLYAAVMFIPLFVIPIFAIYSRNENAQFGYEVTQEVNKAVDLNQIYTSNDFTGAQINFDVVSNNIIQISGTATQTNYYQNPILTIDHVYMTKFIVSELSNYVDFYVGGTYVYEYDQTNVIFYKKVTALYNSFNINVRTNFSYSIEEPYLVQIQCFDLTNMNMEEVTIEEFTNYFTDTYYPYTESQEVVIENYETITYNDTDIGSQFLYALYIPISNYFNVSQLPVFNSMFQWFSYNIFGATAPMWFFIAYNLMMYWLIISLFWLIFDVLMYVPSMVHKMLDKARLE